MNSRIARFGLIALAVVVVAVGVIWGVRPALSGSVPSGSNGALAATSPSGSVETAGPSDTPTPSPTLEPSPTPSPSPSLPPSPAPAAKATANIPHPLIVGGYTFPIRDCAFTYSHWHHDYHATDIYVKVGCSFVAPTSGVVDEVSYTNSWAKGVRTGATAGGLSISIVGNDGVRYYGSHLSAIAAGIRPGAHVKVGQLLGKTGATGDAAGKKAHLHFGISWPTGPGIWWVRRGETYPWPFLDAWLTGKGTSPAAAVAARHAAVGDGPCTIECGTGVSG